MNMNIVNVIELLSPIIPITGIALYCVLLQSKNFIHVRFSFLGFSSSAGIIFYYLLTLKLVSDHYLVHVILDYFFWLSILFFISFLIDLTSTLRPRWFIFTYFLPVLFACISGKLSIFFNQVQVFIFGFLILAFFIGLLCRNWLRSAIDERSRRDGQWMVLVFIAFEIGSFLSYIHDFIGLFWVFAVWYTVLFIAIHFFKVNQHLIGPENSIILDNILDIVIILDQNGQIVRLNRRALYIVNKKTEKIYGNGIELLIAHPELTTNTRKEWLKKYCWLDKGAEFVRGPSIDASIFCSEGEDIPIDLRIIAQIDVLHKITGYVISATDLRITRQLMKEITDREYATRDLAQSESKFSRLFYFNPVGMLIVNLSNNYIFESNPSAEELLGIEVKELKGRTIEGIDLKIKDTKILELLQKVKTDGSIFDVEAYITIAKQQAKTCRLSAVLVEINFEPCAIISIVDISAQVQLQDALSRKQKIETVGVLAGGIAHDFNNILAVILGHIGLAKMRVVDAHARSPIEKAETACLLAREMTSNLLAFSRGGKPVFVHCLVKQLIIDFSMQAVNGSSTACLFDIDPALWAVNADQSQFGQVISNLVGNASLAMNKTGIVEVRARNKDFRTFSDGSRPKGVSGLELGSEQYVEFRVKDQGPGIPEKIQKQIFDPFFTTREKGTGLGLAIVYSIIENHHGIITVISAPGEGSQFIFYLPASFEKFSLEEKNEFMLCEGRVLLMDDDPLVRESSRYLLEALGYTITEAESGEKALDLYKKSLTENNPFKLCLLDQIIPNGMTGSDCAQEILKIDPHAVLFLCSGYSNDPAFSNVKELGFKALIKKPFTTEELRVKLSSF